jgi:hypothetical protein
MKPKETICFNLGRGRGGGGLLAFLFLNGKRLLESTVKNKGFWALEKPGTNMLRSKVLQGHEKSLEDFQKLKTL